MQRGGAVGALLLLVAAADGSPSSESASVVNGILVPSGWKVASPTTLSRYRPKPLLSAGAGSAPPPASRTAAAAPSSTTTPDATTGSLDAILHEPAPHLASSRPAGVPAEVAPKMPFVVQSAAKEGPAFVVPSQSQPQAPVARPVPTKEALAKAMPAIPPAHSALSHQHKSKKSSRHTSTSIHRRLRNATASAGNASAAASNGTAANATAANDTAVAPVPPPQDNYVPAYEGVLMPPSGDVAPPENVAPAVPQETLQKIVSVDCLTKTLEDPNYSCDHDEYSDGQPPPQLNSTVATAADGGSEDAAPAAPAAAAAPAAQKAATVEEAVAQAKAAAASARASADAAEAAYERAAELAGEKPKEAASFYATRAGTKWHTKHRPHREAAVKRLHREAVVKRAHTEVSVKRLHLQEGEVTKEHSKLRRSQTTRK